MELVRCAYCGGEISTEPVAPSEGETPIFREGKHYHVKCWGKVQRERSPTFHEVDIPKTHGMTFEEVIKKFKPRPYTA